MIVTIESPYAGDVERNTTYARQCVRRALLEGYSPFASHLLYTQLGVLDDTIPEERALGIDAGLLYHDVSSLIIFCLRYGWSKGMEAAFFSAVDSGHTPIIIAWDCVGEYRLSRKLDSYPQTFVVNGRGVARL